MRRSCSGSLFRVFLWLIFAGTGWAQNGYNWQLGAPIPMSRWPFVACRKSWIT
jgi:hypothetical protein